MSTSSSPNDLNRQHAVVIGASMAGLLAARVLSDHFKEVTIIERDRLSEQVEPRKGVLQGRHVHILLMRGELILRELFPDLYTTLAQEGAVPVTSDEVQWYDAGLWKGSSPNPIKGYAASRPFLEQHVRRFVEARANVRFITGCEVNRLYTSKESRHISGVSLIHNKEDRREVILTADLVAGVPRVRQRSRRPRHRGCRLCHAHLSPPTLLRAQLETVTHLSHPSPGKAEWPGVPHRRRPLDGHAGRPVTRLPT